MKEKLLESLPKHLLAWDVDEYGCWISHKRRKNGYAQATTLNGKLASRYQLIWEHFNGNVPKGLELDHTCNRGPEGCINPYHLELVTHRENLLRSTRTIPSKNLAKTHCLQGHPFDDENTYIGPNKRERVCRACKKAHKNSDKGKASDKRYEQSEKGKAKKRERNKRYRMGKQNG